MGLYLLLIELDSQGISQVRTQIRRQGLVGVVVQVLDPSVLSKNEHVLIKRRALQWLRLHRHNGAKQNTYEKFLSATSSKDALAPPPPITNEIMVSRKLQVLCD